MKILEDIDAVHVVHSNTDPDDMAFGRYKPVRSYKFGDHPKHAYELAEAFVDGYNQRLGDLMRSGEIMDFSEHDKAVGRITSASGSSEPELPFAQGGLADPDAPTYYTDGEGHEVWSG